MSELRAARMPFLPFLRWATASIRAGLTLFHAPAGGLRTLLNMRHCRRQLDAGARQITAALRARSFNGRAGAAGYFRFRLPRGEY